MQTTERGPRTRRQLALLVAGGAVLAVSLTAALHFLLRLEIPVVLAAAVGLFVVAVAVGRFYLVAGARLL